MNNVLSCNNLIKAYGDNNEFYALDNVSININQGELLVIVGASGSGKSTLLNLLGGIDKCTSGRIIFDGNDITKYNEKEITNYRKKNVGFIYQSFNLINELTVYENILLTKDSSSDVDKVLRKLKILDKKDSYPKELSGGEQQRVAIARALLKKFDILFCDEPTGALDSESAKQIFMILEELCRKDKKTVVIVSHNSEISKIADRVYVMKNGKVIKEIKNKKILSASDIEW